MPSALDQARLEDWRGYLVRFIEQRRPQGSDKNRVTIVFDGNADVFGGMRSAAAKIVFSLNGSADDEIKRIVGEAKNSKEIVVVSDDRDIQYAVRALGARASSVKDFLNKGKVPGRAGALKKGAAKEPLRGQEKYISKTDETRITSEFSRIWLDPKRKRKA